jgi:galactokinase
MAIDLGTTAEFAHGAGPVLTVTSAAFADPIELPVDLASDAATVGALQPAWARLIGAMVALARPGSGGRLTLDSTLPLGAGLSSSAALCVALAEVFGVTGGPVDIARLCQTAEQRTGVPVGAMDPLVCAGGRAGHALLIDFADLATEPVRVPDDADIVVVDSGLTRTVDGSAYGTRVAECEAAAAVIGPLGRADLADLVALRDPLLRRRARHVVSECLRVRDCARALAAGDLAAAGRLMDASHASLAGDFEVSTPALDQLAEHLRAQPGVFGARMTGAGFGGCVVALSWPGAVDLGALATRGWRVRPSDGTVASRH